MTLATPIKQPDRMVGNRLRQQMRIAKTILVSVVACVSMASAQTLREKAETNPLDCAIYLATKNDLEGASGLSLTRILYQVGRFDDTITVGAFERMSFKELSHLGLERLAAGDKISARKFADAAFNYYEADHSGWRASDFSGLIELLIATGRSADAQQIADAEEDTADQANHRLQIAEARFNLGDRQGSAKALERISLSDFDHSRDLFRLSDLYTKLGSRSQSLDVLTKIEAAVGLNDQDDDPDHIRLQLAKRYYSLGDEEKGKASWGFISDANEARYRIQLAEILAESGNRTTALKILDGIDPSELSQDWNGGAVVKQFLKLGRLDQAWKAAIATSAEFDDYTQQSAFMDVADHYIKAKNTKRASEVLDYAFQRARKVVFEHRAEDSVGASSGSRKATYLKEIAERYLRLDRLDRAYTVLIAIDADHWRAREHLAYNLAKFASASAKKLPLARIKELFAHAVKVIKEADEEIEEALIRLEFAEAYATIGENDVAIEIIAEQLERFADDYGEGHILVRSGEIFEKFKLKSNIRLRSSLVAILEAHE